MLGKNLELLLKKWGMKQKGFSDFFENMNHHKISSYINNKANPSVEFMLRLEEITGLNVRKLYLEELDISDFPSTPFLDGKKPDNKKEIKSNLGGKNLEERMIIMEKELEELKKKI